MKQLDIQISNRLGLHARAAAKFVHLANRFDCSVSVSKDGSRVNGKSILGLLTLAASQGTSLRLAADGHDEVEALNELTALVEGRFGEEA